MITFNSYDLNNKNTTKQNPSFTSRFDRKAIRVVKDIYSNFGSNFKSYGADEIRKALNDGFDDVLIGVTKRKYESLVEKEKNIIEKLSKLAEKLKVNIQKLYDPKKRLAEIESLDFYAYFKLNKQARLSLFSLDTFDKGVWSRNFPFKLLSSKRDFVSNKQFKAALYKEVKRTNDAIALEKNRAENKKKTQKVLDKVLRNKDFKKAEGK
ncbi:MAG: hypothetical protein WCY19_02495 [Candidatus Gastranaerophilaceae bacterium]